MPVKSLSFSFLILCHQQYEQCSSSSSSGTTAHCELWFPIWPSSSPSGLWPLYANFFVLSSNYLQPHSPSFLWPSSFLVPSIVTNFGIFRYSPLSVCPRNLNLRDFINFTKLLHVHICYTKAIFFFFGAGGTKTFLTNDLSTSLVV